MSYIKVSNLTKEYQMGNIRVLALNNVSFTIEKNEFVVILGKSGAGKTTLLNILGGMDNATRGEYQIEDDLITNYKPKELSLFRKKDVGFVFQFYNLMPNLTALENVDLAKSLANSSLGAYDALELVGLGERKNNFPANLSGGEQQRVSIARAIVKEPKLLLCDEPTGALDSKTGVQILELLYSIVHNNHKTVVVVTHNESLTKIADRVIRISDGRIIENKKVDNPMKVSEVVW